MPLAQDILRPYARLATTNRLMLYGALSTLAVSLVILNAFKSYSNFYSVAVYLSRSNRSVMVLANFGVLGALLVGRGLQHVLFGSLRATEVERLYDRIWFFLTESLLAFTIFRDEFDSTFALMFGFLLFVKCFHWLMSFRIEWMDQIQYPGPNMWFHVRMNVLFLFLWCIDTIMLCFAIESILTHGIGGIVLFASEYAILMASALNSMSKYFIIFYDIRRAASRGGENAPVWEDKSMYIFYVELATDFLKLITYLTFFMLVLTFYGLPLNIVRDVYITARSFINRCRDLVRYRTATRNMDERYPNATEEELNQMNDRTCIICREEMLFRTAAVQPAADRAQGGINDTPKKLPCGHMFHFHCLRSWLERQQSCPTCRRTVLETRPARQNAGAAGQPRAAAAPQPGAIPQLQGFGGQMAPQQPQQPGFLARWLGGVAAAPPIVPGQFAPAPVFFNPQQGVFNQQPPPPPGFPEQNPFGPWQQPGYYAPVQQQQPGPVQVLQGFYIGNQWQPWGAPVQPQQPRPPAPVRTQAPAPTPHPHANHTPVSATPPPTQTGLDQAESIPLRPQPSRTTSSSEVSMAARDASGLGRPTSAADSGTSEPSSATSAPPATNPREAAGLAALRRFSSRTGVSSPSSPTTATVDPIPNPRSQPGWNGQTPVSSPSLARDIPSASPTSTSRGSAGAPAVAQAPRPPSAITTNTGPRITRTPVPSLIPLFDPATTSATIVAPPAYQRASYTVPSSYPTHPSTFNPQQRPRPRPTDSNTLISELLRSSSNLPDLRSLPQTLSDEQLSRLDTLTREAIDERLRSLENVQGAVWRCVEELVRVRSVLPPPRQSPSGAHTQESNREDTAEKDGLASNEKGKAKATNPEDIVEPSPSSSPPISDSAVPAVGVDPHTTENGTPPIVSEVVEGVAEPAQ